ncbi:MAG: potassium-transporting ATPase subunit KdpA, partial [Dehalococcoidales bacterium]|nr:potassium-transporting ATPase subunit KdpA [Dehalococcoidales bacterium]
SLALLSIMVVLFLLSVPLPFIGEFQGNPELAKLGVAGGVNLEGKEMRYTMFQNVIWIVTTMTTANGSTVALHDSLMPLTVLQILLNLAIAAPIFGCIGTGSMTAIHYMIVSMFLAALMTGRTSEMIGKKLDLRETVLACVSFLSSSFTALGFAAIVIMLPAGLAALGNAGPRGLTEALYTFISTSINNGSAMAGVHLDIPLINLLTIVAMISGRFSTIIVGLMIGGSIARKGQIAVSAASLPIASPLFIITVIFVIIIMSALTFFPALALGPILEYLLMQSGVTF